MTYSGLLLCSAYRRNPQTHRLIDYKEYFTNLAYKSEIYGTIEISFIIGDFTYNNTFEYSEYCNDTYNVDININSIADSIELINKEDKKEIISKLQMIDYNDIS